MNSLTFNTKTRDFDVTILTIIRVLALRIVLYQRIAITNAYVCQSIAIFIKRLCVAKYSMGGLGNSFCIRWFKTGFFSLGEGGCILCLYRLCQTDLIPLVKFDVRKGYAMLKVVVMNVIRDICKTTF